MNFDELDLQILNTFIEDGKNTFTSTYITKKIFDPPNGELSKKNTQIIYRLNKLCKNNLLRYIKMENIKHYSLNTNIITIGECYMHIGNKSFTIGNAMMIELKDNTIILDIN